MKKIAIAALLALAPVSAMAAGGYGMLNAGIDYYNQGRYDDAITWLGKAIDAGDLQTDQLHIAHLDRGLSLQHQEHNREAIEDFSAAVALAPGESEAVTSRAFAYLAVGEMDHAVSDLSAAHEKYPKDTEIDRLMGLADWQLGRYAEAQKVFARIEKADVTAWFWQQLSNVKLGKEVDQTNAPQYDPHQWPNPLKEFYMGRLQSDAVMKLADAGEGQACDVNFYVGEWFLVHGDKVAAEPLLEKAIRGCPDAGNEPRMAAFELKKMAGGK